MGAVHRPEQVAFDLARLHCVGQLAAGTAFICEFLELLAIDQGSTDGNCSACGARVGLRSSAKASGVPLAPSRIGAFRGQGQRQGARSLRRAWNVVASSRRQRNTGNYVVLGVRQNRESIARTARE